MERSEFVKDLPVSSKCECCQKVIDPIEWGVSRCAAAPGWMAVGVLKCSSCSWLKIAAAGSNELAQREAYYMRLKLIAHMGL